MSEAQESVISVSKLCKQFRLGFAQRRVFKALDDVSLSIGKGMIAGFLGPNGAGKTTTIKVLTGMIFPDSGEATVFGLRPNDLNIWKRLGYLPENPAFHDHLTGAEVLRFACELLSVPPARRRQRIGEVLELVGLTRAANLQVRRYSKGMTQRLGIAQALVHDPELLILDEPMSGLDPIGRREVKDLLRHLAGEGKTLFFSTHIVPDVEDICSRVTILFKGKVVRDAPVRELIESGPGEVEVQAVGLPPELLSEARATSATGMSVLSAPNLDAARELVERIWAAGATVHSMNIKKYRLEDYFLKQIGNQGTGREVGP